MRRSKIDLQLKIATLRFAPQIQRGFPVDIVRNKIYLLTYLLKNVNSYKIQNVIKMISVAHVINFSAQGTAKFIHTQSTKSMHERKTAEEKACGIMCTFFFL